MSTATLTRTLDVTFEEARPGHVRLGADVPPGSGLRLLELATTAALHSVSGGGHRLLAHHVLDLDGDVAGRVAVVAEQVHAGARTIVVRAVLLDADGVPRGQSVVSAAR